MNVMQTRYQPIFTQSEQRDSEEHHNTPLTLDVSSWLSSHELTSLRAFVTLWWSGVRLTTMLTPKVIALRTLNVSDNQQGDKEARIWLITQMKYLWPLKVLRLCFGSGPTRGHSRLLSSGMLICSSLVPQTPTLHLVSCIANWTNQKLRLAAVSAVLQSSSALMAKQCS